MKKEVNTLHCILKQVMITNINANGLTGKLRKNINLKAKLNYQITSGSLTITENGTYDIARYNEVVVDTVVPSGDIEITTNGTYDVAGYENAIVDCPADLDWTALGYNNRPPTIDEGYEYALEIKNNWDASGTVFTKMNDRKLLFFPEVDCSNYTEINIRNTPHLIYVPNMNTSKISNFSVFFSNCYALQKIESIDTSNGTILQSMFSGCYSLKEIPEINTSKITSSYQLFRYCYLIKTIPSIDLGNATNTSYTFADCTSLTSVPTLNISKSTTTSYMFYNCGVLETVPEMNTSLVQTCNSMFSGCSNLKNVPIYNMSSVTSLTNMFQNCNSLTDESLYNIIESLLTATSYTGIKKLTTVFSNGTYNKYANRIQALSNYQDLINAGWS